MLLGLSCARFLGNLFTGKGVKAEIPGRGVIKVSEGTIRAGQDFNVLMSRINLDE